MEGLGFFLGHHKSGTRYIGLIFEEFCEQFDIDFHEINNPKWFGYDIERKLPDHRPICAKYMNAKYRYVETLRDFRGFHVIRDPRDLAVSAYFSHLHSHSTRDWPELVEHREKLRALDFDDGLLADMEFTDQLVTDGFPITVFPAMDQWNYDDPRILEMRFEDVVRDPLAHLTKAFAFIGLFDPASSDHRECLERLVRDYSFKHMSGGREPGQADDRHHYRSGVPGEGRSRLKPVHLRWFEDRYPALLARFDRAPPASASRAG
jgi:hypothetical protein